MSTVEERVTALETEFRTELRHLATKSDLSQLEARLIKWMIAMMVGGMAAASSVAVALSRIIQ